MVIPSGAATPHRRRTPAARHPGTAAWSGILSSPPPFVRNALFALFIGGILAYGAGFAWHMLARFDLVALLLVNADDAFYYFQIAWHMARGEFSTFDGGITRTNGYHPLWLLLITPFYWVFDKAAALFAIKVFEIMLVAGGVSLIAAAARLARLPWILLFAALPMLYRQDGLILGTEAAAGLFMLGLFFFAITLFAQNPARWRWPLATVAFALPWMRLEYAAISLAATAALLLIEWSWRDRPAPGARERSLPTLKAVGPFLAAGAGLLAYFGYNGIVFGGIVPVSAVAKQVHSHFQWEKEGGYDLARNVHDFLQVHAFDNELWLVLEVFIYVLLVWWFAHRSRSREGWLLLAFLVGLFGLAAGHLAKFVQSILTVHLTWGSYIWYFVPVYLMEAILIPARCFVAIWLIRHFIGPRLPRASGTSSPGIVIVGAAFLYATTHFTAPFRLVDRLNVETSHNWNSATLMGTMVMNRVLPEGSVVGSWDSGMIGYFSHFPVVNLDGLVNSYDYVNFAREYGFSSTTNDSDPINAARSWPFAVAMRILGITHFTNVKFATRNQDTLLFEGPPCCFDVELDKFRQFELWSARPLETSSGGSNRPERFWERMEHHFRHQEDGIGLLVDGRLAQAFSRNCATDMFASWTWGRQGDEILPQPWTHTRTGLCVSAMVIPHETSYAEPG